MGLQSAGVLFAFGRPNPQGFGADRHAIELYRALATQPASGFTPVWQTYGRSRPGETATGGVPVRHRPVPERLFARRWRVPDRFARRLHAGFALYHHAGISTDPPVDGDRLVVSFHDLVGVRYPESPGPSAPWASHLLSRAKLVLTLSKFSRSEISEHFPGIEHKVRVVGSGCDTELFNPAALSQLRDDLPGTRHVVVLGGATARKNHRRTLDAVIRVAKRRRDVSIIVAGGRIDIAAATDGESLLDRGRIISVGYVSDDELAALYAGAAALVYPSLYEGFGLPIVEAFAAGCPVVTARGGATEEVAGGLAELADPADVDSIADAVTRCLDQGRGGADTVAARRRRAEEFTWRRCAERHVGAYLEALGR